MQGFDPALIVTIGPHGGQGLSALAAIDA